ncbi:MAG: 50S ribosomal protein L15e [Candidatus Aenigmarchaeota archaeon CG_4_10_14_0_8_um_filter_37_24]|nr:50S ribosomal protein L15e [Candidatus Aenigmarchaeota archaeon]OIN88212.1 MAG: 50S ribosomal protein L15e [Candidatus Aenigmarchaeota archaeon CG1_02_38_14]PIV68681.1 MAG: 50S ribosomal protein L15e [Candidatus Aenigmarchaeota archaeon CG01_land_8_20_14_3_00_37_9]PIW41167.1 MAG: 50S ribosomal protein L15e [Candidatus Aenigmarchaeota archaeon CG15_BIG_FIL_POST_REV_8_21_14_020_37_27]PIX50797.1 MAG: 50S ribosomal protein L15e [Candidatus Aenigmarchaeota archaeon CG_4_8_14_3_um_filter_37_24]PI
MVSGLYQEIRKLWKNPRKSMKELTRSRLIEWRREGRFERVEKPTRIDRARSLGYKAKNGFVIVRGRIGRGGRRRPLYGRRGRKPSKSGLTGFTSSKSLQWMMEERIQKKYPNLEVLGSYEVGKDGSHKWFEVILVDPVVPEIMKDKNLKWVESGKNKRRVFRGLTSSGKKGRALKA